MKGFQWKDTEIHDVVEYLQWIKILHEGEDYSNIGGAPPMPLDKLYFRGQVDKEWQLLPGIFRKDVLLIDECEAIRNVGLQLWNELSICKSYLERLVYLQHYGMWTRLLDVTFNPLIALFMACSGTESEDKDGVVFFGYQIDSQDSNTVEKTAEFVFSNNTHANKDSFERFLQNNEIGRFVECFMNPHFIFPPISNPRIESQNGAFIMAPPLKGTITDYTWNNESLDNTDLFGYNRAIVPSSHKKAILRELSELGINRGSLFRDAVDKISAIKENYLYEKNYDITL